MVVRYVCPASLLLCSCVKTTAIASSTYKIVFRKTIQHFFFFFFLNDTIRLLRVQFKSLVCLDDFLNVK